MNLRCGGLATAAIQLSSSAASDRIEPAQAHSHPLPGESHCLGQAPATHSD